MAQYSPHAHNRNVIRSCHCNLIEFTEVIVKPVDSVLRQSLARSCHQAR